VGGKNIDKAGKACLEKEVLIKNIFTMGAEFGII